MHPKYSDEAIEAALAALTLNGGNVSKTARALGWPASTLRNYRDRQIALDEEGMAPWVVTFVDPRSVDITYGRDGKIIEAIVTGPNARAFYEASP